MRTRDRIHARAHVRTTRTHHWSKRATTHVRPYAGARGRVYVDSSFTYKLAVGATQDKDMPGDRSSCAMQWSLVFILFFAILATSQEMPPDVQSKFFAHYVLDRNTLILKRKVFLYRNELYTPWSEWGNCSVKDCTEFRFRRCLNDSYEERITNLFRTNSCPFQYVAETRRCLDDSQCHKEGKHSWF